MASKPIKITKSNIGDPKIFGPMKDNELMGHLIRLGLINSKGEGMAEGGSVGNSMSKDLSKTGFASLLTKIKNLYKKQKIKGDFATKVERSQNASSGKGGRGKARRPAGFGISSSTRKSGTGKARKPAGFGVSSSTRKSGTGESRRPAGFGVSTNTKKATTTGGKAKSAERKSGMIPDTVPQERRTTPEGKMGSAAKRGPSNTRKKNTAQTRKPRMTEGGPMPKVSGTSKSPMKRPTQSIKNAAKPNPGKPNTEPRTIAQAKKQGKLYFVDKNGKKKAAVTAEDLKKSGHKSLRAYLNAKGKPAKKGS